MGYTNSPLVNYTKLAPANNHYGARTHAIDTITIHCVVGQCTVEGLGSVFAPAARGACSNYGVGYDGRIGLYCEEKNASGCSSNKANDERAVTIEVASDTFAPYAVTAKAYNALIELCADICKRNGIKKLLWKGDKSLIGQIDKQNMTAHKWFAATACPGEYLYSRFGDIAAKVNAKLSAASSTTPKKETSTTTFAVGDTVKISSNATVYGTSKKFASFVYSSTLYVREVSGSRIVISTQKTGAVTGAVHAQYLTKVSSAAKTTTPAKTSSALKVGDKVRLQRGAPVYGSAKTFASFVYNCVLYVRSISGSRVVISTVPTGAITGAVDIKYLTRA